MKLMKKLLVNCAITFLLAGSSFAADVGLSWDVANGATGYKIQMSIDNGLTWTAGVDVGNVTAYTLLGVSDTGLVFFRILSYNGSGEALTSWAGAWYNGDWQPPAAGSGLGVQ